MIKLPRIYYLMVNGSATGGERHSYEHVDILNDCGFDAYALHLVGQRHPWCGAETRVIEGAAFWDNYDQTRDYIVLPETQVSLTTALPGKKVIFNKGLYSGFNSPEVRRDTICYPYTNKNVVAAFAVSDHNYQHLEYAFPDIKLFRMYAHIDCDLFAYRTLSSKKRQIALVVKSNDSLSVLYHILNARARAGKNNLADYKLIFLEGYTHSQVAEILGDSLMLISLNTHEGMPRIVLEAMASGCIIAGHGTGPLKECLLPEYQFEPDDSLAIARHVEDIAKAFQENVESVESWNHSTLAARKMAEAYTKDRQKRHLLEAWDQLLCGDR